MVGKGVLTGKAGPFQGIVYVRAQGLGARLW